MSASSWPRRETCVPPCRSNDDFSRSFPRDAAFQRTSAKVCLVGLPQASSDSSRANRGVIGTRSAGPVSPRGRERALRQEDEGAAGAAALQVAVGLGGGGQGVTMPPLRRDDLEPGAPQTSARRSRRALPARRCSGRALDRLSVTDFWARASGTMGGQVRSPGRSSPSGRRGRAPSDSRPWRRGRGRRRSRPRRVRRWPPSRQPRTGSRR